MAAAFSLKDYLKRYESVGDDQKKKKRRKKEKPKPKPSSAVGIRVVDEDPVWQKPVQIEEESDSSGEEKPQIDEDIEVKRMKRLEAIRARRPYHAISEDGSGWVSISDAPKSSKLAESDRDLSPTRQGRARFDTPSPEPDEKPSGSRNADLSPPRHRRRRVYTPTPEGEVELPGNLAIDISPPRRRSADRTSPPRRIRKPSTPDHDLSPPRRSIKDVSNDLSPLKRTPNDLSAYISPRRHFSPDATGPSASPDTDLSPPRRGGKGLSDDLSRPRRIRPQSPEGIRRQSSTAADLSPPRKRVGLVSREDIKEENAAARMETLSRFASMNPNLTGQGAEPVFRDNKGKRISKEELMIKQEEKKPKEKKLEWGKGLAQKREAEAKAKELELEKDKPFARTRDDPDLDKMLKERIRWGDPMAHLVKRNSSEATLEDLGDNEQMKESGFIIPQTIPSHSWLKRGIDFPPNRYGTKPGRHWDGVDRSNGFEKEMFKRQNDKHATEREAYLWSVSDM